MTNTETLKIELSNDKTFKKLFLEKQDILLQIINDILDIKSEEIEKILGYDMIPDNLKDITYYEDILIKLPNKIYVGIEMNNPSPRDELHKHMVDLSRIQPGIYETGKITNELTESKIHYLNFNKTSNPSGRELEKYALCSEKTGKIKEDSFIIYDVDINKCYELADKQGIEKASKLVRWGAIMLSTSIKEIDTLLGDAMLTKEQKETFLNATRELNNN